MPALDDYDPPAPTWLAVCLTLEKAEGPQLLTKVKDELQRKTRFRAGRHEGELRALLDKLQEDGVVEVARVLWLGHTRRGYRLSDVGRDLVVEARELARTALGL